MGIHTDIEWCDSSLNLQMGCDGCELWNTKKDIKICYSGTLHQVYAGPNKKGWPESFDKPKLFLDRLEPALRWPDLTGTERPYKPWLNGLPRMIFLNDMGDTFTESLPLDWLAPLLPRMAESPHIFMLLTKRAGRMRLFSKEHPFPKNFVLMTSITSEATVNRLNDLVACRGGAWFGVSYEPAQGWVDFTHVKYGAEIRNFMRDFAAKTGRDPDEVERECAIDDTPFRNLLTGHWFDGWDSGDDGPRISQVIIGGASGKDAAPFDIAWPRELIGHCRKAGIAPFVKQLGAFVISSQHSDWIGHRGHITPTGNGAEERWKIKLNDKKGGDWSEWPEDLRVRDFPEVRNAARV